MTKPDYYILLVDDDPDDRYIIHASFKDIHWSSRLKLFSSAEEALRFLRSVPDTRYPSLIVLDYNMPKINGAEALQQIKETAPFKDIPVVVYSTGMSSSLAYKLTTLGAQCCFQKPSNGHSAINLAKALKMIAENSPSHSNQQARA